MAALPHVTQVRLASEGGKEVRGLAEEKGELPAFKSGEWQLSV